MTTTQTATAVRSRPNPGQLSLRRLHLMRAGYLLMGLGLVIVKWPLLPSAHTMPVYEGVVAAMLVAMSLFALLGLRYPVKMLPVLLFESAWKLIWLATVALPRFLTGDLGAATQEILASSSLVVVILLVTPWRFAWRTYVREGGDRWR